MPTKSDDTRRERARVKKVHQRLATRNVLFIERAPAGLKEWLAERGAKKGTSMVAEAVAILEAARKRAA